jgi:hypothetical protein
MQPCASARFAIPNEAAIELAASIGTHQWGIGDTGPVHPFYEKALGLTDTAYPYFEASDLRVL